MLLDGAQGVIRQVTELGKIDTSGKDPEKRISSNFLTVPLKKASEQARPYYYPKRPANLMKLGQAATGIKWGVGYHDDWRGNLPKFTADFKGATAFTDLAVFVFRDAALEQGSEDYVEVLSFAIANRYTAELSNFWIRRIEKEKVMVHHINTPFSQEHSPFAKFPRPPVPHRFEDMKRDGLIEYIFYLEGLLDKHHFEFERRN